MRVFTYPIIFRFITMLAICSVSRPLESPNPGVSMIIVGSFSFYPRAWVTNPWTSEVSDYDLPETFNVSSSPHNELAVDDLPCPVTPIIQIDLNLEESDSES